MSKPHVLYLLHSFFDRAGTEEHSRYLARGLSDRYRVSMLFPHDGKLWLSDDGQQFKTFRAETSRHYWSLQPLSNSTAKDALQHIVHMVNPNLIHVQHLAGWPIDTLDILIALAPQLIVSFHDFYCATPAFVISRNCEPDRLVSSEYARAKFGKDVSGYLRDRLDRLKSSIDQVQHRLVPSRFMANELQKIFPGDYRVISHGIPEFTVPPVSRRDNKKIVFGFLGNMLPHKGWSRLLKAFGNLRQRFKNVELHFHGNPKNARVTEQSGVRVFGSYSPDRVAEVMSTIDVVVIPSLVAESYCLVLSEAWMAGRSVAASNSGALAERIQDGSTGRLFETEDIDSIEHVLSWFVTCDTWRSWKLPRPKAISEMCDEYANFYAGLVSIAD